MNINKEKIIYVLTTAAKIISLLSLIMTVVIKTRTLLGLKNPSEKIESTDTEVKEVNDESES